ncbi:MAG TPA: MerC domain-containing protein [Rudaea sp.]|nr:MerC domain-containing protein [Rudaea sp.]
MHTEPAAQDPRQNSLAHAADRVGATASLLCALHCAALPFVLSTLPALGLGFLADHLFERVFIACASGLALATLIGGYRRHHDARALRLLVPGLLLLWTGGFLLDGTGSTVAHAVLVALGGACLALSHVTNLRLMHGYVQGACCETHAIV